MSKLTVGFALCGSFCTFDRAVEQMRLLKGGGAEIVPIMSFNAAGIDSRFGTAAQHIAEIEGICGRSVIDTITAAEPIGPKKLLDILIIEPCTGNTLAKLANGITDTPVTLAAKAHLRNERPVLIGLATVLSMIKIYQLPYGGSVTLASMLPIVVICVAYGPAWGFAASFVYSIIQFAQDGFALNWGLTGGVWVV